MSAAQAGDICTSGDQKGDIRDRTFVGFLIGQQPHVLRWGKMGKKYLTTDERTRFFALS